MSSNMFNSCSRKSVFLIKEVYSLSRFAILLQVIIAAGIFNVWVLRRGRPTNYRPCGASNISEEFARYGFSDAFRRTIGTTKLTLAALLLLGTAYAPLAVGAASGMAILMFGALAAHVKVRDPMIKSIPALLMLLMSTAVVVVRVG